MRGNTKFPLQKGRGSDSLGPHNLTHAPALPLFPPDHRTAKRDTGRSEPERALLGAFFRGCGLQGESDQSATAGSGEEWRWVSFQSPPIC